MPNPTDDRGIVLFTAVIPAIFPILQHTDAAQTCAAAPRATAARIESMCRELGRKLLLSSDFVKAGGIAAQSLGAFTLKGVGAEQEIFVPI